MREFPEGTRTWRVSTAGGRLPTWTADGRELLYVAPDGGDDARNDPTSGTEFTASPPQPLFKARRAPARLQSRPTIRPWPYDVRQRPLILLAVPISPCSSSFQPINVILNWEQLLKGLKIAQY